MHTHPWKPKLADPHVVESLQPRNAPYFSTIAYGRHLGAQIKSEHCGFWVARVRTKRGCYKQHRIGPIKFGDGRGLDHSQALSETHKWWAKPEIAECASESYPVGSKRQLNICLLGDVYTVGHAMRDYLKWKRIAATESHYITLVSLINFHIVPRISAVPLAEFNAKTFHDFALDVLETLPKRGRLTVPGRSPLSDLTDDELRKRKKTLNAIISILKGAFEVAWEHGQIETDRPMRCLRRVPNVDRPRVVFLNRQECLSLVAASRPDLQHLVLGALYTGCRANELMSMQVSDLQTKQGCIFVRSPKGRRSRYIHLPKEALWFFELLTEGKSGSDYVFLKMRGTRWSYEYKTYFREAQKAAGLPESLVFHSLRHTYASQLVQAGASLIFVANQLGHSNTATVSTTYGHFAPLVAETEITRLFEPLLYTDERQSSSQQLEPQDTDVVQRYFVNQVEYSSWPKANFSRLKGDLLEKLKEHAEACGTKTIPSHSQGAEDRMKATVRSRDTRKDQVEEFTSDPRVVQN